MRYVVVSNISLPVTLQCHTLHTDYPYFDKVWEIVCCSLPSACACLSGLVRDCIKMYVCDCIYLVLYACNVGMVVYACMTVCMCMSN